jgi:hypothetical protein
MSGITHNVGETISAPQELMPGESGNWKLLEKSLTALPKGGALIVYDAIIDDERRSNAFGLLMSLNVLIETRGGFDYTGADCQAWMRDDGFGSTRVEPVLGPGSMVSRPCLLEGYRRPFRLKAAGAHLGGADAQTLAATSVAISPAPLGFKGPPLPEHGMAGSKSVCALTEIRKWKPPQCGFCFTVSNRKFSYLRWV